MTATDCGAKHMRLLTIILTVVVAVVGGSLAWTRSDLNAQDVRLRAA